MDLVEIGNYLRDELASKANVAKLYEADEGELWGLDPAMNFTTRKPDLTIGEEFIEFYLRSKTGDAVFYDGMSSDIPNVGSYLSRGDVPAKILINSATWNYFELEREMVANASARGVKRSIVQASYMAMAEFLNRKEHYTTLYGDAKNKLEGLFNQSSLTPIDFSATQLYATATSSETIYDTFIGWISTFMARAKLSRSSQIKIKVPEKLKLRLTKPFSSTVPNVTLYQMLTDPSKGYNVAEIQGCAEAEGANLGANISGLAANRDRIIFQTVSESLIQHFAPRVRTPNFQDKLDWTVYSYSGITSSYLPLTNRMMYIDMINTAS